MIIVVSLNEERILINPSTKCMNKNVFVCVCVCESVSVRERERESVFVFMHTPASVYVVAVHGLWDGRKKRIG